jgi:hypothetical protein
MDVAIVEVPVSERVAAWPLSWSGVWVGTLGAIAATLLGSLLAVAFRAYDVRPGGAIGPEDLGVSELAASVCIAFFSFVIGGWAAARIAGFRRAEPAMIHGAIAWLLAVPIVFVLVSLGARSFFGAWYGGFAGTPVWASPGTEVAAKAAREAAGGTATALLIGLIGAVVGGWMGSGEPMRFSHYRSRQGRIEP